MVFPPSLPEWLKRLHPVAALSPRCLSSFPACKRIRGPFLGHSPVMCFLFIPLGLPHRVKAASSTFTCLHCRATAASPLGPTGLRKSRRNPNQPRPEGGEGVLATRPGGRSALQAITWVTVSSANCGSLGATRQRERGKQASPVRLRRQQMAGEPEPRTGAGPAAVSARGPGHGDGGGLGPASYLLLKVAARGACFPAAGCGGVSARPASSPPRGHRALTARAPPLPPSLGSRAPGPRARAGPRRPARARDWGGRRGLSRGTRRP